METYKCCICGFKFTGYGNNPWPVSEDPEDLCCDECNYKKVIPERIREYQRSKDGTEQS